MTEIELKTEEIHSKHIEITTIDANHVKCFTFNKIWNNQEFVDEYGDINERI